jgi:hypothetical protein
MARPWWARVAGRRKDNPLGAVEMVRKRMKTSLSAQRALGDSRRGPREAAATSTRGMSGGVLL